MIINFRQGIISYDFTTFPFVASGFTISLNIGNQPVFLTAAQGNSNYTFSETSNITNAWTIPTSTGTYWLYWDFNTATLARTFGVTAFQPAEQPTPPSNPQVGQMWYNTTTFRNYVFTVGGWTEVIRVFAAKFVGTAPPGQQFISMGDQPPLSTGAPNFTGTQIGSNVPSTASGTIVFDYQGNAIRKSDGTFFTTEDQVFANGAAVTALRLESNVYTAFSSDPSIIPQYGIVAIQPDGSIQIGSYNDAGNTVIGMTLQDIQIGGSGAVCIEGTITNPLWDFTGSVGQLLWISGIAPGSLQPTNPHLDDPITYPLDNVPVARVLSAKSIMFLQGIGTKGPPGPPGSPVNVQPATPLIPGIVKLSTDFGAFPNPTNVVVAEGDPRLSNARTPLPHTHPASQITVAPDAGSGTTATNVQQALQDLGNRKLNLDGSNSPMTGFLTLVGDPTIPFQAATKRYVDNQLSTNLSNYVLKSGSTMTGPLILGANPTTNLQAATKQYVDNVASGLTFQAAVSAATTANLNAIYSGNPNYTLTEIGNGALVVDGVTLSNGQRVLVKNQTTATQNGIYDVTDAGSGSTPWILTRNANELPPNTLVSGTFAFVNGGTQNNSTGYVLSTPNPIVIDATNQTWVQFSSAANVTSSAVISALGYTPTGPFPVTGTTGINVSGSPVQGSAPTGITLSLGTELVGLNSLNSTGFVQRTGVGSYIATALTSSQITTALGYTPLGAATLNTTAPLQGGGSLASNLTLTITQFTGSSPGSVPLSPGGVTQFLRADGVWAVPPGSTGGSVSSVGASTTSTGLVIGGTNPITSSGTITFNLNAELQGLAALATTGKVVRTGAGSYSTVRGEATDIFFATSNQTAFTLTNVVATSRFPGGTSSFIRVFLNGVLQREDNAAGNALAVQGAFYVSAANQITFFSGLTLNDEVSVYQIV